ncbi:MAG: hypothetical protein VKL59_23390 [Nostocaceae cyanobacterium]|nr:hypothetical protein [Nostocaceae cyanobacterium]
MKVPPTDRLHMSKVQALVEPNEIAVLGSSLRAIDQKILKPGYESGIRRIWYQGEEPYFDVFFDLKNNEIRWFQFTLRGHCLSWDVKHKEWQTGSTNELKLDDVKYYPASKTIETDHKVDWAFISLVKSILQIRAADDPLFAKALKLFMY